MNADLDTTAHLEPPPDVIEVDDGNNAIFVPPHNGFPFVKQELSPTPTVVPDIERQPPPRPPLTSQILTPT
jgi:hypothetical protein